MIRRLFTAPKLINRCAIIAPVSHGNMATRRHHAQKLTKDAGSELSKIRNDLHCLTEKIDRNKTTTDMIMVTVVNTYLIIFASLIACTFIIRA